MPPLTETHGQQAAKRQSGELFTLLLLSRRGQLRAVEVETMLYAIRNDEPIVELAPPAGELTSSCLEMMEAADSIDSPELRPHAQALSQIFDFLARHLRYSVQLLAYRWRSERLREQQRQLGPLGEPGDRLRRVASEIERLAADADVVKEASVPSGREPPN